MGAKQASLDSGLFGIRVAQKVRINVTISELCKSVGETPGETAPGLG